MNKNVIKCNLEVYSAFILKFGSTTLRPYKYEIEVENNLKVNIQLDSINKKVILIIGSKKLEVPVIQYDHILLTFNSNNKRRLVSNSTFGVDLLLIVYKSAMGGKVVMKNSKRTDYKQDPTMMKKGKYRHRLKAFWTKRSDLSRGKFSRDNRFKTLTDLYIDAKLNRSYNSKHVSMKFAAWKLGLSVNELQQQLALFRMTNGNTQFNFKFWLNSYLINILVLTGFYSSYTSAKSAINNGEILLNGVIINNINLNVFAGDLITVKHYSVTQLRNIEGLLINTAKGSIYIKTIPNLMNILNVQLNKDMFSGDVNPLLADPMLRWLTYTSPFLARGFNR